MITVTRRNQATPESRFPFKVEEFVEPNRPSWASRGGFRTLEAAEDHAWSQICQSGGRWRVRRGDRVLASGSGYTPGEHEQRHDRTALWTRHPERRCAQVVKPGRARIAATQVFDP
jgi:hypothetical protein